MGRQSKAEAFGAVQPRSGQRQELRQPTAQARQIPSAADIREDADRRFRHGEDRALRSHAEAAGAGDADAAAHGDAIHEGDAWFWVSIFEVVEAIFVKEEGARSLLRTIDAVGDGDDVAAGAEAPALGMVDEDNADVGIVAPFKERG